ncbi:MULTISPECIES: hypothetical protein [Streptomyces]|uniref:Uncharacterized protein n=1 Tax=Streptomyces decoyicus TaxID=249567 RepID=A0ABZ1FIB5_9ACTN|nr:MULTISPECIES: hypothetical protein [Streptomyces]MCL7496608.1 hypothetical protein [Streptomyces sp. MCA2]WSB69737.1 hypothetical protein OG863_18270 [Streptomyces decoyicus]
MTEERRAAADKRAEAEAACAELAAALKRTGIVLPSLGVDPVSYGYAQPRPLIELGRCNLETTHRLIAALDRAAR